MELFAFGVILLTVPFLLPIALWVALYRTRTRLALLEAALQEQREVLNRVSGQLAQLSARPAPGPPLETPPAPLTAEAHGPAVPANTVPGTARLRRPWEHRVRRCRYRLLRRDRFRRQPRFRRRHPLRRCRLPDGCDRAGCGEAPSGPTSPAAP